MDTMEIDDGEYINKNLTMEDLIPRDFQRRKQPSRCLTLCLGLLCAVLLGGNIGQIIFTMRHSALVSPTQAGYSIQAERLRSSNNALTAERKQLEARLTNMTEERDQLQQRCNSLTTERDEFNASFGNLRAEKDQLQATYDTLKQESDQLKTSNNDMRRNLEGLQTDQSNLTASRDKLQIKYGNLQREKDELQTRFHKLQGNYSLLRDGNDQLQRRYDTLTITRDHLQASYNSLWKDKELLQARYNTLLSDKEQLEKNYSSMVRVKDELQKKIDRVRTSMVCQTGWKKFNNTCYFVSTVKKNWTRSREDCIAKGGDLVVINSRDEQAFLNGLLMSGDNAWIGLTDSLQEGIWMWVDGTRVTTAYWQPGQPNSYNGNQDCGEFLPKSSGVGEWNDDGCFSEQTWICEK